MEINIQTINKFVQKNILGPTRLRDLIKAIRACKTAADERAVIAKESASIRAAFREEQVDTRHINVSKLLYIFMLGYPAHFGQMEALKLVASPKFTDKKLGYLGIMLLLDENQETLTLVTNCLKNDMASTNMFISGIALCTLGNISSPEMARDLAGEVEGLLSSSNVYIRKKACLCALRIIRKVPDLTEIFLQRAIVFLSERSHAVLLTGITLLIDMYQVDPETVKQEASKHVSTLVRHLKNLQQIGFSLEHDVSGITDPFLQIKILRLLRLLGAGNMEASEHMNDVLAQVATNTESSKNVGNSILYEAVLTIMEIESDNALRIMGINILGRFLSNRDNNIRYVALTTLTKCASKTDQSALQRHRATIIECLTDADISIRRRALDLSFHLINAQNIRILTRELLTYLETCQESESKASIASRICEYAGRFRPNVRWEMDTIIRILRIAGSHVDQSVINSLVKIISTSPVELQAYAVRKLYKTALQEGDKAIAEEGYVQALFWTIGEFGDLLVGYQAVSMTEDDGDLTGEAAPDASGPPTQQDVVQLVYTILQGPHATELVQEHGMVTCIKLAARFDQTAELIKNILAQYKTCKFLEIQQRAVEYDAMLGLDSETRNALLERMPVLASAVREEEAKGKGNIVLLSPGQNDVPMLSGGGKASASNNDLLGLDAMPAPKSDTILDMFDGLSVAGGAVPPKVGSQAPVMDIFSMTAALTMASPMNANVLNLVNTSASQPAVPVRDALNDLFAVPAISTLQNVMAANTPPSFTCYEKNGLVIVLVPTRDPFSVESPCTVTITARFQNVRGGGDVPISDISLLVAVPKSLKLTMMPASSTSIAPGEIAQQQMKITNPSKAPIKLRLKIGYMPGGGGAAIEELVEFSKFDPSLWA